MSGGGDRVVLRGLALLAAGVAVGMFDLGVHVVLGHGTALSWWAWCLVLAGLVALWLPVEPGVDGGGDGLGGHGPAGASRGGEVW